MEDKIQQVRRAAFETQMDAIDKNPGQWLDGEYKNAYGQAAWLGFNAALDAVVIELPKTKYYSDMQYGYGVEACRSAITSTNLGIKVK